ncbi:MAG: DUF2851 family protein [Lentisphaeria bacterium]|nr:DUF2851 family protein [Lentisphaeria bacterium]
MKKMRFPNREAEENTEAVHTHASEPELAIQKQWSEVRRGAEFRLTNGALLRVLSPGRWNRMPGPDFRNAKLELNGAMLRGDIEVHVKTSDWISHGHGGDQAYDGVILHVVRHDDSSPGNVAFLPEAGVLVLPEAGEGDDEVELKPQAACAAHFAKMISDDLETFLCDAGADRLRLRADERLRMMISAGTTKAFLSAVAEQLGVPDNREGFRTLAERLREYQEDELTAHFEALAWGESGLLPDPAADKRLTGDGRALASAMWNEWWPLRKNGGEGLFFKRTCRPLNSPERRLAMLGAVGRTFLPDPCGQLAGILKCGSADLILETIQERLSGSEAFWDAHTSFRSAELKRHAALFGRPRVESLFADVILPVMAAYAKLMRDDALETRVFELFRTMPPLQSNLVVRRMQTLCLAGRKNAVKSAAAQQGLIHLYKTHCEAQSSDCGTCRLYHSFASEP